MKDRKTIEQKYKWNLNDIYENYDMWESDLEKFEKLTKEVPKYKGQIKNSSEKFVELELLMEKIARLLDRLYLYPYMLKDLDSTDEMTSIKMQEIEMIYTKFGTETAWIAPEMLEIPEETMNEWIKKHPELEERRFGLSEMYRLRKHVLSEDKEQLLSHFSQFMGSSSDIYGELSISDMKWNTVKLSTGEELAVSNGVYSKILATNRNQEDRKLAFEALYKSYENSKNTFAAIYRAIIQQNVASCNARSYESCLDRALENKNIPKEVYFSLVNSAQENTAPLRRYIELRKKALKLKEYHYYDNSINIVDYNKVFKYDDAKEIVLNSVKPLGEDYQAKMKRAISEGWLDVFETKNKRSGAYSINIYDVHPYMLLNYQETMDAVFTLAHELGHTLHSMHSSEAQPYSTADYTIFVAEVASTFNERLLLDYMLENSDDSLEKIALLEQALGNIVGTYYIQTLFASYEYEAHKMIEEYKAITPDILSDIMYNLFKKYFGESITIDELQKIIWSRIPHFFRSPFYVYQYATSFASSAKLYENLKTNPESREKYLTLLKSGGNNHPMEQLKLAGVDLTKKESFDSVAKEFDRLLDVLEEELKKINLI
ncbi:oligoendopeptidase F [Fusobacterium periodonticum]|uniref:Oligopeptidase F n=1 Tax=Fusobacterium periodonticum 1_1_41FAA TaxID=469621 RepID=D6LFB8_9FUSO|nr:oligoendopeptidase F [Fusobacterium periodonticum]EFG28853.1 oligoendopeptidase F [Fusobacterium periodonticum 1_1_41FAA]